MLVWALSYLVRLLRGPAAESIYVCNPKPGVAAGSASATEYSGIVSRDPRLLVALPMLVHFSEAVWNVSKPQIASLAGAGAGAGPGVAPSASPIVALAQAGEQPLPLLRLLLGHSLGLYLLIEAAHTPQEVAGALAASGVSTELVRSLIEGFLDSREAHAEDLDADPVNQMTIELAEARVAR